MTEQEIIHLRVTPEQAKALLPLCTLKEYVSDRSFERLASVREQLLRGLEQAQKAEAAHG